MLEPPERLLPGGEALEKIGEEVREQLDRRPASFVHVRVVVAERDHVRERVAVEHRLAHISRRQGRRARYRGAHKNLFDLRRACTIQNFETIQRKAA